MPLTDAAETLASHLALALEGAVRARMTRGNADPHGFDNEYSYACEQFSEWIVQLHVAGVINP